MAGSIGYIPTKGDVEGVYKPPFDNENYKLKIYIGSGEKGANNSGITDPITAYLPEQVSFSSISNWAPFIPDLLGEIPGVGGFLSGIGKTVDNVTSGFGYQMNTRMTKIRAWKGNQAPTFSFDLQFNAIDSPFRNVLLPIIRLLSLTMPSADPNSAFVEAPGPDIMKQLVKSVSGFSASMASADNKNKIASIGNLANLSSSTINTINSGISSTNESIQSLVSKYNSSPLKKKSDNKITLQIGKYMIIENVVLTSIHPKIDSMFTFSGEPVSAEASCTFELLYPPTTTDLANWFIGSDSNRPGGNVNVNLRTDGAGAVIRNTLQTR